MGCVPGGTDVEVLLEKTDGPLEASADIPMGDEPDGSGGRLLCLGPRAPVRGLLKSAGKPDRGARRL
jgi:hypothetical protein